MQIAMVGLGRMGKNMALHLKKKGHDVICWNRSPGPREEVAHQGCRVVEEYKDILGAFHDSPRIVWLMLPAGDVTDHMVSEMLSLLDAGDILINGANNHFTKTLKHAAMAREANIQFLDIGVSGGTLALELGGYCTMIGGDENAFRHAEPIIRDLCVSEGYAYFGEAGTGHYVKMVHNGIEYANMQAIAEGFEVLKDGHFSGKIDLKKAADVYDHGSILAGTLMWATRIALKKDQELTNIAPFISDSGEGKWTVQEAIKHNIPFTSGAFALFERYHSREKECYANKLVAAQRNAFGSHPMKME